MSVRRFTTAVLVAICMNAVHAQTPVPIIVPAAGGAVAKPTVPVARAIPVDPSESVLRVLEQMKAENAETLRKQEALLQALDQLQQAADQLRIFTSRT